LNTTANNNIVWILRTYVNGTFYYAGALHSTNANSSITCIANVGAGQTVGARLASDAGGSVTVNWGSLSLWRIA
jgi:hypothetical protein